MSRKLPEQRATRAPPEAETHRRSALRPSNTELILLKALWAGPVLSAREIHERTASRLGWSYSSTRKTLERMRDKGLVQVKELHGVNVYAAKVAKVATLALMARDFMHRVLEIETPLQASAFVDSRLLDEDELAQLEALLQGQEQAPKADP